MTAQTTEQRLGVPGARLHVEVRGAGPLLLVVGQPMTSAELAPLAEELATGRTVVTYDPRGMGSSTVDDPDADVTPEVEAADLAAIIDSLGGGPADVFGTSGGAVAALALAYAHPDRVRTVVAHEPPVPELLPDARHVRAAVDGVVDAYLGAGAGAAWGAFVSLVMHDGPVDRGGVPPAAWPSAPGAVDDPGAGSDAGPAGDTDDGASPSDAGPSPEQQAARDRLFFLHMLRPFTRWVPPVQALRALGGHGPQARGPDHHGLAEHGLAEHGLDEHGMDEHGLDEHGLDDHAVRVVVVVGEDSGGEVARRSSEALAELLGPAAVVFPGGHGGFLADPALFADALRDVLPVAT